MGRGLKNGLSLGQSPGQGASSTPRQDRQVLALLDRLLQSETWPDTQLKRLDAEHLKRLLDHAYRHVPYYAASLAPTAARAEWPLPCSEEWLQIPLLTRENVLRHVGALRCMDIPAEHGSVFTVSTSGSTGQPVEVQRTGVNRLMWEAINLREHIWHGRDARASIAVIRANVSTTSASSAQPFPGWGMPFDKLWTCGPSYALSLKTDVAAQARWLNRVNPRYLLTYPTNLEELLNRFEYGHSLSLHQVMCIGETVSEALRARCAAILGCKLVANYSSQEVGYMAVQCPECEQYHVQSEAVYVEVLRENGRPCRNGEIGRVVVTDLHNFAMPLIRYEIGDYAQVGKPCTGKKTLPSLSNILGRSRNMVVHPDGRRHWPLTGFAKFNEVAPIKQYQFIQHSIQDIEVRLVSDTQLTAAQFEALKNIVLVALGSSFRFHFQQCPGPLPRTAGGKFEEFVCLA